MIRLFYEKKSNYKMQLCFEIIYQLAGKMPAIIAFRRVFPSTVGNYADEEKSVESTCVSLSLPRVQTLSAL